jgi:putative chitinase
MLQALRAVFHRADDTVLRKVSAAFMSMAPTYGLTTNARAAALFAQVGHESMGLRRFEENLNYSAKRIPVVWPRLKSRAAELARNPEGLANAAYANKIGNGDEASGDGYRFRGRGLIQLTGRANYHHYTGLLFKWLLDEPDRLCDPDMGTVIAMAYWVDNGLNELADKGDIATITRRVNGPAMLGLKERKDHTAQMIAATKRFSGIEWLVY